MTDLILFCVLLASVDNRRDLFDAGHENKNVTSFTFRILVVDQLKYPNVRSRIQLLRGALFDRGNGKVLKIKKIDIQEHVDSSKLNSLIKLKLDS